MTQDNYTKIKKKEKNIIGFESVRTIWLKLKEFWEYFFIRDFVLKTNILIILIEPDYCAFLIVFSCKDMQYVYTHTFIKILTENKNSDLAFSFGRQFP